MTGWVGDIEAQTVQNDTFRTVLFTGEHAQLIVMSIPPGEEIGLEAHGDIDQFLRIEQGSAQVLMGPSRDALDEVHDLSDDWAVIVPAGVWHNVINTGDGPLKLYSIYSPAEHPDGAVHETKADADGAEAEHDH